MGDSDVTDKERRVKFYDLMNTGEYKEAYDYLMKNGDLIGNMKISELASHYRKFRTQISIGKLSGLTRILKEGVFGENAKDIFP